MSKNIAAAARKLHSVILLFLRNRKIFIVVALIACPLTAFSNSNNPSATANSIISASEGVTLADFWNGGLGWEPMYKLPWRGEFPTHTVDLNGVWYMFGRSIAEYNIPGCDAHSYDVVVRTSTDKGRSWSPPKIIASPGELGGGRFCHFVDTTTIFDAKDNKWHLLTQCMDLYTEGWAICYLQRDGADANGKFKMVGQNPVITGRQLFSQICVTWLSPCSPHEIYDEGTPQIVEYKDGLYYVTFHGYDGTNGYRILAKTPDFQQWTVIPHGPLSNGFLFTKKDCKEIQDCIGPGYASIIKSNQFYYMLVETPNVNLRCTNGQVWPFNLYRTQSLEAPAWEKMNPIYKDHFFSAPPVSPWGCDLQYNHFFRDSDGEIYIVASYYDSVRNLFPSAIFKLTRRESTSRSVYFSQALHSILDKKNALIDQNNPFCGPAHGKAFTTQPQATQLCTSGNPVYFMDGQNWTWSCDLNGRSESCFATRYVWQATDQRIGHLIGQKAGADNWAVTAAEGPGRLSFGPHETTIPTGDYNANFYLKVSDNKKDSNTVAQIEVFDSNDNYLAKREIKRQDFRSANSIQAFALPFRARVGLSLDLRVYVYGHANIEHDRTELITLSLAPPHELIAGQSLRLGDQLQSQNGRYILSITQTGLRIDDKSTWQTLWEVRTVSSNPKLILQQSDGHLVLYNEHNTPLWATYKPLANSRVILQDDGNLVQYPQNSFNANWSFYGDIASRK